MQSRTLSIVLLGVALLLGGCRGPVRNPAALTPLPSPEAIAPPTITVIPSATVPPTATPIIVLHTVAEGDTLFGIAIQYGTTVESIREANGLDEGVILQIGQELKIPQ